MTEPSSRPMTPPSRWLAVATVVVVVIFTAWRLWLAATLDFRSDEAYYWSWSHQWVLSYLDHPPMVAWFERLGQLIFGDTLLGTRFAQLLALPLIQLLLADIARRRTRSWNAALFVVLALECALYYGLIVAILEPSIPLLLFTSLLLWALCLLEETADGRWWLLVGVAAGLALLSKYIALLLVPAVLLFMLSGSNRHWLRGRWPYLALLIAIVVFSPVLIWNALHGFVSFYFQSSRLEAGQPLEVGTLWRFVSYELLSVGAVLAPASIVGALVLGARGVRFGKPFEAALATAFLFPALFFFIRSLSLQINQSWAYFMWPIGVLSLALVVPWHLKRANLLVAAVVVTGVPFVTALFLHGTAERSVWFGRGDPFGQDAGFGPMAEHVLEEATAHGATWIATSEYRTYAVLLWHIGLRIPVVQVNERARFTDFATVALDQVRGKALYVYSGRPTTLISKDDREPLESINARWRGTTMSTVQVDVLSGFAPDLDALPGSEAYRANP